MQTSIVICTDGRATALANTLNCLRYLDGPDFEVCVVAGPTDDSTADVLAQWTGRIKLARNPERNLSVSRNIGIALAAGDLVAFVDDDGLPEPAWLAELGAAFADPEVGGAGGVVMDHTGAGVQYLYASADRLGNADLQRDTPAEGFNFPCSFNFPYVQGTNSIFRRAALLDIGGFDEEFEFYLDETDACCRLIDAGWLIRQLPDGAVHHKFLPSAIRTADRVTRLLYPVLKNKLYFSIVNNRGHYTLRRAVEDMIRFARTREADLCHHIGAGRLKASDLDAFRDDLDRAWDDGLKKGLAGARRMLSRAVLDRHQSPFLPFPRPFPPGGRDVFVFLSREYPPGRMGGIGRYIHQMARAVAELGHHVHVLTEGTGHDRIDFEEGAWIHRLVSRPAASRPDIEVPEHIWNYAGTMLAGLRAIARRQTVTAVYAPIWDCEGAAILMDGTFPLVVGLQTMLRFWLDSHPHIAADRAYAQSFAEPMIRLETLLLRKAECLHANSDAICRDIAGAYGVPLAGPRTEVLQLGLDDWSVLPAEAPAGYPEGALRLLFVGRLESRKGIDVLLDVLPHVLARHRHLHVDIVGNDTIPGPDGRPYRAAFEAAADPALLERVHFHGEATEPELRGFYAACDIFAAPSRFESFGLILVEAMMYGKPVVTCRAGGMMEVAEDGVTALLAMPGDAASLMACLHRLIEDPALRDQLGKAGRKRYEARFTAARMSAGIVDLLRRTGRVRRRAA